MSDTIHCSFCGKGRRHVKHMIAGPETRDRKSYICDDCIVFGFKIVQQETAEQNKVKEKITITPRSLKTHLDQFVIGQDYAKKVLSVAVYNHYKRIKNPSIAGVELQKSNILMVGASGVGKTLLVSSISKALDIPFSIADATSITEAGYVGDDAESIIERLIQSADGDVTRAQHGIIYIDEIDKKVKKTNGSGGQRDISGEGVQQALLKMVEGTIMRLQGKRFMQEPIDFDTTNILFIVGGAFVGLDQIVKKNRKNSSTMGFTSKSAKIEEAAIILEEATPRDIIEYGLIPEFVGRFPVLVPLNELTEEDLLAILTTPKNNLVDQFKALFALDTIELEFSNDFLVGVARECIKQKTGARGLRSSFEKALLAVQYDLPQLASEGIRSVLVGTEGNITFLMDEKEGKVGPV